MFADALRSEAYRLLRNRTTVFWGFLFAPLLILIGSLGQTLFIYSQTARITRGLPELSVRGGGALDLGDALLAAVAGLTNPLILLFTLIAAATLFAGDYRWETWRLINARNSRANLILGKIGALVVGVGVGLAAYVVATLIGKVVEGLVFGRALTFSLTADSSAQALALVGVAWLRIVQFLMIALLAAVVTRSLLAALFIPLVWGIGQMMLGSLVFGAGLSQDGWTAALLFPGMDADVLKAMILRQPLESDALTPIKAWAGLLLWTVGPAAGALLWFQRQNLSKE